MKFPVCMKTECMKIPVSMKTERMKIPVSMKTERLKIPVCMKTEVLFQQSQARSSESLAQLVTCASGSLCLRSKQLLGARFLACTVFAQVMPQRQQIQACLRGYSKGTVDGAVRMQKTAM